MTDSYLARLILAVDAYRGRREYVMNPEGFWDGMRRWHPSSGERRECFDAIRQPSTRWPNGLLDHCRTARHLAQLYGVDEPDLLAVDRTLGRLAAGDLTRQTLEWAVSLGPDVVGQAIYRQSRKALPTRGLRASHPFRSSVRAALAAAFDHRSYTHAATQTRTFIDARGEPVIVCGPRSECVVRRSGSGWLLQCGFGLVPTIVANLVRAELVAHQLPVCLYTGDAPLKAWPNSVSDALEKTGRWSLENPSKLVITKLLLDGNAENRKNIILHLPAIVDGSAELQRQFMAATMTPIPP